MEVPYMSGACPRFWAPPPYEFLDTRLHVNNNNMENNK